MLHTDVDTLVRWFGDPEVWPRWWGHEDSPYEPEEIAGWFALPNYEPDRFLIAEEHGTPIGHAQWHKLDHAHLSAAINGFIEPASRGHDLGPRALRLLAEYLVERRDFLRVEAHPDRDNRRAARACEKAGFRYVPRPATGLSAGHWTFPAES